MRLQKNLLALLFIYLPAEWRAYQGLTTYEQEKITLPYTTAKGAHTFYIEDFRVYVASRMILHHSKRIRGKLGELATAISLTSL
jgi:hypothetical protein